MDYEEDLAIDGSILDVECVDQPMLVIKYARLAADAEKIVDNAKEKLDLVKAELDSQIRSNPEKFGLDKLTETIVANTILTQQRYKNAMSAFIDAKYDAKIISGATRAVDHRKSMLETLVKLHGQQYFAGPSIPHDLVYEQQQKAKQRNSDKGVAQKMQRRRKGE